MIHFLKDTIYIFVCRSFDIGVTSWLVGWLVGYVLEFMDLDVNIGDDTNDTGYNSKNYKKDGHIILLFGGNHGFHIKDVFLLW